MMKHFIYAFTEEDLNYKGSSEMDLIYYVIAVFTRDYYLRNVPKHSGSFGTRIGQAII